MAKLVMMLRVKDGVFFVHEWLSCFEKLVDEIRTQRSRQADFAIGTAILDDRLHQACVPLLVHYKALEIYYKIDIEKSLHHLT